MLTKLFLFLFGLKTSLCSCQSDRHRHGFSRAKRQYRIEQVGHMPAVANENSGLATASGKPTFWTHNDSGGKPELYEVDSVGNLLYTWALPDLQNKDWEELSRDPQGNIYIGDTGNNTNTRKDLCIYKVSDSHSSTKAEKITYHYPDQKDFPPQKSEKNFDCEAFFFANDSLYLFSKNWGKPTAKLYTLPARAGDYTAILKDSIRLNGMITAADISPDQQTFAVLTYGKVFFFAIEEKKIDFKHPLSCLKIGRGQVEALVFVTNHDLLVTNEKGKIYKITRR
ncbi:hypothetical protein [Siphonobacter sp. SORGH_AS_0500]|uniref:hypothetical protein n=1 Tax=Siphonobacter sp. SORGH_AS_0500 TaxID=1864824 RepID=UPI002867705A|nr:hypothetical protein [Siphonobacter sp. SORGH_AS_0500]MDR6193490.1 hypothetical protein [Siphonobacter sp. SORGH_AS_0500]